MRPPTRRTFDRDPAEVEFQRDVGQLIAGRSMKVWLARSTGLRIDTIVSVGDAQAQPIKVCDHIAGYYLFGEGVTPDLLSPLHKAFDTYCHNTRDRLKRKAIQRLNVRFTITRPTTPSRLVMHYPFTSQVDKGSFVEELLG